MIDSQPSLLEKCCNRLAVEFGIVLQEDTPSTSFTRYRSGERGKDRLEYALAAGGGSEYVRMSTTDDAQPYVVLEAEAGAQKYRITINVPAASLSEFTERHASPARTDNPVHGAIANMVADAIGFNAFLPGSDATLTTWVDRKELTHVTAGLIRAYVHIW